ncbi:MAG TPA: GlsB/YeaQ/YmgE family stress response membrane protein [Rhizomicrobium sp.]|nr:GlsB/YeaQ/YmgE family stress response membrane protein [Rhizomicrobium sp.]
MHVIGWIIVGLVSGFVASRVVNRRGEGCLVNIALGLVGALVGGALFQALGHARDGGFFYSIFVSVIGAIIVLLLYHAITGRRGLR